MIFAIIFLSACLIMIILLIRKGIKDNRKDEIVPDGPDEHSPEHLDFERVEHDLEIRNNAD